ncbi:MAG: (d)CMP kinase [Syntrophobacteraceae bacterium]|nr:(d)CMP kinase [Syntrophobacteraceae bacterium]
MIIAIDGPAGAGKSTVCKILANRLGFVYLDTGAMYRAVAWAVETGPMGCGKNGAPADLRLREVLLARELRFCVENDRLGIFWGEKRLTEELRTPEATEAASRISRLPEVRQFLVEWQRRLAREASGIVAEGRDTATVVFPDAELKVFLTADLKTRAKRRFDQYFEKGEKLCLEEIEALILARDAADSKRAHSPMRMAEDAVFLDTSGLSVQEVVDRLSQMAKRF